MDKGISIIIPTYNREEVVTEAILSVLNQNYKYNIEIIISDDGSTDSTLSTIKQFTNKVKIIEKPEGCTSQGAAGARNRGIQAATQSFVCFLDSDDVYLPGHFEKIIPPLVKNPEIGFAFCRALEFKTENEVKLFRPWTRDRILKNDIKNIVVARDKIVNTNSFMFRKEVFKKVGYFNENYSNGEDGDLWMRISEQFKGIFVSHFGSAYRKNHSMNQLTKKSKEEIKQCSKLIFEEAKKRYHVLNLKDQRRLFKIKLILLQSKASRSTKINFRYHFEYLILILLHPLGYFQKKLEKYYDKQGKEDERNKWYKLEHFNISTGQINEHAPQPF